MFNTFRESLSKLIYPVTNAISLGNEFLRYGRKAMTPDWTEVIMSDRDHYSGYSFAAIRNRANSVATVATENVYTKTPRKDGFIHPYLELISNSPNFSEYQFWRDISIYLDLEGIFYLMAVRSADSERYGDVQSFKLLNPYNIRRVVEKDTLKIGGYVETRLGQSREIPPEMIIEIKELNPFNEFENLSTSDASKESQFTLKTSKDYTRHALKNNINAPGILTTDIVLSTEKFKNFVSRITNHEKGEPVFGNGAGSVKWTDMNIDLSKASLKEINSDNRDELFSIYGVSKTMMGIEESGTTRETAKVQLDLLVRNQSLPRIQLINDSLNQDYKTKYPKEYSVNRAEISCINPLGVDQDVEVKKVDTKTKEADLYDKLLKEGYDQKLVAEYVKGNITIDQLGEPKRPALPDPVDDTSGDGDNSADNHIHSDGCEHDLKKKINALDESSSGTIKQQEGALKNAVINIEQAIVAGAISKIEKTVNQFEEESEIITKSDKNGFINELELVLIGFYGIVMSLKGGETMRSRMGEYSLAGLFSVDKNIRKYIKETSKKVAISHIQTVTDDILVTAREAALKGLSQREIVNQVKEKYSQVISETRAKTIARTETNRAFTRAQYEADVQFINQNKLGKRAYKQWITRSDDPCPFCRQLASEGLIPFNQNFRGLGEDVFSGEKSLPVNFEALAAGNAHPNCSCVYELVILDEES
jgi:phage portal protein BeeE